MGIIVKANPHAHPGKLADYLLEAKKGERTELYEIFGFAADNAHEALMSAELLRADTKAETALFHLYVRTEGDEHLSKEQLVDCIMQEKERLGFGGQPHVISFHIDEQTGHLHPHMAVSRMAAHEDGRFFAIDPGLYKNKCLELAAELEIQYGLKQLDRTPDPDHKTLAADNREYRQGQERGIDTREVRETIRECLDRTLDGNSFMAAIEENGLLLSKGRRDWVVIDQEGGPHGLNKKLTGLTAQELRERFADIDREQLPSVEQAKEMQAERRQLETERALDKAAERQAPEPAAPMFDRDAAEREWMEKLADAAIAYDQNRQHSAGPEAVREFAGARTQDERPLGRDAGETRLAYSLSDSANGFIEALEERGIRLSRVSSRDVENNEREREGYRQYADAHPDEAKAYGIKEPPRLREGDLVAVSLYKDEPRLCFLNERTTGDRPEEVRKFLGTLQEANLPDIAGAAHDLREAREKEAERVAEPPLGKTAGEIRLAYSLSRSPEEFLEGLEARDLKVARVHLRDVHQNNYEFEAAEQFGLRRPAALELGEIVVVNRYGSVSFLNERTTGDSRDEIAKYLSTLDNRELPSVYEARQEHHQSREIVHDPALDGKYIYELREMRAELKQTRDDVREQLRNEELLSSQRVELEQRQAETGMRLADVRMTIREMCAENPMLARDEFASFRSNEGQEFGESAPRGMARTVLSAGKDMADFASSMVDIGLKLFDAAVDFFITPSLPTPELIHARREAREAKAEQAELKASRNEDDARQRAIEDTLRQMKEAQEQYRRQRDNEPGRERERER
jgi:hypothetical protein